MRGRGVRGALRLFGPGAIIASVTIGSGETFFASKVGAIFGYSLLWFILVCGACKLVQVYGGARYMVLAGEHPMEAWSRLPGPRGWFPALIGILSIFCFPFWLSLLSMMVGTTLNWIIGLDRTAESDTQRFYAQLFSTGILLFAASLTLVQTYRVFEKVQIAIVVVLLVVLLVAAGLAPIEEAEALRGLMIVRVPDYPNWMHVRYPDIVANESVILCLVIFMTAIGGGTYDYIGYLSFYRNKGWGALGREGGRHDTRRAPVIEPTDANVKLGRRWLRAPVIDVFTGFACVVVFTVAFNLLGAAILHPEQLVPDKFELLTHQARFLTRFGAPFKILYQIGILMAFCGTIYGALEVYSRTAYECFRPLLTRVRDMPYARFRLPVCLYGLIGGLWLIWRVADPMTIIMPIGPVATVTCGIWCFAIVWADRKVLPRPLNMSIVWIALSFIAGATMTGFGTLAMIDLLR